MAATAKHYVANDSETGRMHVNVRASERVLREVYLAPFEAAVDAGVWLVMAGYNSVNGASMTASPLLAEPLKGDWGFDGVVVSDWGAVRSTVELPPHSTWRCRGRRGLGRNPSYGPCRKAVSPRPRSTRRHGVC